MRWKAVPKFFEVELPDEVRSILGPRPDMTDDQRANLLQTRFDFVVVWEVAQVHDYKRLGAPFAVVRPNPDGVNWPMGRAADDQGNVHLIPRAVQELFALLHEALRDDDVSARHARAATFAKLEELAIKVGFDAERRAALDAVARLGSRDAVLSFLEADG